MTRGIVKAAIKQFASLCMETGRFKKAGRKLKKSILRISRRIARNLLKKAKVFISRELKKRRNDEIFCMKPAFTAAADPTRGWYTELDCSHDAMLKLCSGSELLAEKSLAEVRWRISREPMLSCSRLYHYFHQCSKWFRQEALRLDGEKLVEVYDITDCDLLMHAIHLNRMAEASGDRLFTDEASRLLADVRSDRIRRRFGVAQTGKVDGRVKLAFKIAINGKKRGDMPYLDNLVGKIASYMKREYPRAWEYFEKAEKPWETYMKMEFELVSDKLFRILASRGVKMLSVHDAVYMRESEALSADMIDHLIFRRSELI
jgi:hypothetical protein